MYFEFSGFSFGDTFYKIANQSRDRDLQQIASDYIVHYDYSEAIANASTNKVVMAESKQFLEYIIRWAITLKENKIENFNFCCCCC